MTAINGMTIEEAVESLRRGDFSLVAPLFGDLKRPEVAEGDIVAWLDAGALASSPDALNEALTCACWHGQVAVARRLLEAGANAETGTSTGLSALHWAANRGQREAVDLLLERGVSTERRSMYGGTALGTAVWSMLHEPRGDQLGVIRVLLEAGADAGAVEYPTGRADIDALLEPYR